MRVPAVGAKIVRMKRSHLHATGILAISILQFSASALAQTCFTSDDMDAATRSALQAAGNRYFDMVVRGDVASLKQNSIPTVVSNFGAI